MKIKLVKTENLKKIPKILRKKSKKVEKITPEILDLVKQMDNIMNENNGVGISAIQVGAPFRIMIAKDCEQDFVFINPEITNLSKKKIAFREGCLSFPGYFIEIIRPEKVKIKAKTLTWEDIEAEAGGLMGRAFLHEIDHMDGKLFLDYVDDYGKIEKVK